MTTEEQGKVEDCGCAPSSSCCGPAATRCPGRTVRTVVFLVVVLGAVALAAVAIANRYAGDGETSAAQGASVEEPCCPGAAEAEPEEPCCAEAAAASPVEPARDEPAPAATAAPAAEEEGCGCECECGGGE